MPILLIIAGILGGVAVWNKVYRQSNTAVASTAPSNLDLLAGLASNGITDNNPGNLTDTQPPIAWLGRTGFNTIVIRGEARRFTTFDTILNGLRALMINTLSLWMDNGGQAIGLSLVQFGEIWAPTKDNPGAVYGEYGSRIASYIGVDPNASFDFINGLEGVAQGIIINERGQAALASVPLDIFPQAHQEALQEKGLA